MFDKILIANRGEIACRVALSAKRLGIATVAVYSEADANAMHVALCDEAYLIGPAPARESYLRADKILEVAKKSGAQAIHPGYGFLSENADFSEACEKAGISFVGPTASAIRAMGSKSAAKKLMSEAGVPVVPGYHGDDQSDEKLQVEADKIGYPLLIKASAGGGGKGMRIVNSAGEFNEALGGCRRESQAYFGDDKVILERYLSSPRHIELQIFSDTYGNAVHLFERDCSIQRRHQKVIEEAPAPGMTEELRERMGKTAIKAARAIGYVGAGTVEFLLDKDSSYYFMEMNTRLQVEHPVTEMISGQDLVHWQLSVASGGPLPITQNDLRINGHAIEVRVYAENPGRDFLPSMGKLTRLISPEVSPHLRIDTGVRQGDEISMHYDPMIAKLVVWDMDRAAALQRMQTALVEYQIGGVDTNLEFLAAICANPFFERAELDTSFIDKHKRALIHQRKELSSDVLALAVLYQLLQEQSKAGIQQDRSCDPYTPWGLVNGWRMNSDNQRQISFFVDGEQVQLTVHYRENNFQLDLPDGQWFCSGEIGTNGNLLAHINGRNLMATVVRQGDNISIIHDGLIYRLELSDPLHASIETSDKGNGLMAPMPGSVAEIMVSIGDKVSKGDALIVVEAMKMEHTITAPNDGSVKEIHFEVGDQVGDGDALVSIES